MSKENRINMRMKVFIAGCVILLICQGEMAEREVSEVTEGVDR